MPSCPSGATPARKQVRNASQRVRLVDRSAITAAWTYCDEGRHPGRNECERSRLSRLVVDPQRIFAGFKLLPSDHEQILIGLWRRSVIENPRSALGISPSDVVDVARERSTLHLQPDFFILFGNANRYGNPRLSAHAEILTKSPLATSGPEATACIQGPADGAREADMDTWIMDKSSGVSILLGSDFAS